MEVIGAVDLVGKVITVSVDEGTTHVRNGGGAIVVARGGVARSVVACGVAYGSEGRRKCLEVSRWPVKGLSKSQWFTAVDAGERPGFKGV
ncbi:hypothetical protein U1Q18_045955 [Sarracenia purpurea var. burkii]